MIQGDQLEKGLRKYKQQEQKQRFNTLPASQATTKESQSHTKITAGGKGLLQRDNTAPSTALRAWEQYPAASGIC